MPGVVRVLHRTRRSASRAACRAPRTRSATPSSPSARSSPRARCAWSASRSRSSSPTDRATARDAADRVVVDYDPLPVVIDAENARRARRAAAPRRRARQPLLHDRAQDRGLRRRLRRRARQGLADDRQPAADAGPDRAARRARRLERVAADELTLYTSTQVPHFVRTFVAVDLRHPRVELPRDRARRRRRLRREAQHLRRGVRDRAGVAARRRARQVDRDRSEAMVATIHGRDQLQHVDARGRPRRPRAGAARAS